APCRPARGDPQGVRWRGNLGLRADAGAVRAALQHPRTHLRARRGARPPSRALVPGRTAARDRCPGRYPLRRALNPARAASVDADPRRGQTTVSVTSMLPRVAFE